MCCIVRTHPPMVGTDISIQALIFIDRFIEYARRRIVTVCGLVRVQNILAGSGEPGWTKSRIRFSQFLATVGPGRRAGRRPAC